MVLKFNTSKNPQTHKKEYKKNLPNKGITPTNHRNDVKIRDMRIWGHKKGKSYGDSTR